MSDLIHLRCSSLPLASACMASQFHAGPVCETNGPEARLGTAVHECLALHVQGLPYDADAIAAYHQVDPKDVAILAANGRRCLEQMHPYFGTDIQTERYMEAIDEPAGIRLTGHLDVYGRVTDDPSTAIIVDWKSGYRDPNALDQLRGYAMLIMSNYPEVRQVWAWLVMLREQAAEKYLFELSEIERWWMDLSARIKGPLRYSPGANCRFCSRGATCEAKGGYLWESAEMVQDDSFLPPKRHITPAHMVEMLDRIKVVEDACGTARALIKAEVAAAGGTLETGDGRALVLGSHARRSIDYPAAASIIDQQISIDDLIPLLQISKTKLEDYVRRRAPRGQKQQAVKDLMDRLEQAGALETTYTERLEVRNVPSPTAAISAPESAAAEAVSAE